MDAAFHPPSEWKIVRLELGRTAEFPAGSPSRAYLLRLPLRADGSIDEEAVMQRPGMATVRRFWANEPDRQGYLIKGKGTWAFSYQRGEQDDENLFHLEAHPLLPGEYITLTEPDGRRFPFKVAAVNS